MFGNAGSFLRVASRTHLVADRSQAIGPEEVETGIPWAAIRLNLRDNVDVVALGELGRDLHRNGVAHGSGAGSTGRCKAMSWGLRAFESFRAGFGASWETAGGTATSRMAERAARLKAQAAKV